MARSLIVIATLAAVLSGFGLGWTGAAGLPLIPVYATFAALALWGTWADDDLRWVGLFLVVSFLTSNWMHAQMAVTSLPGPYSMLEVMVLLATAIAWGIHRNYWSLVLLAGINVFSICCCVAFAAYFPTGPRQIFLFELTTNLCFAAECLLAAGTGIVHGYRTHRFTRLPWRSGRNLAANANRSTEAPE